jgi:hypothetical protein
LRLAALRSPRPAREKPMREVEVLRKKAGWL